jgi:YD repeat-containing protein
VRADGRIGYVDAMGNVTTTQLTHFDRPCADIGPDGGRTEYAYDTELRLVEVKNPQCLVWRYGYDAIGNLVPTGRVRRSSSTGRAGWSGRATPTSTWSSNAICWVR